MNKNHKKAFSLIELSVVLVVISIIIAGALSASTVSINNAKTKITNDRIKVIYRALGNYILTNYKLPCPAALNITKDAIGYGNSVGLGGTCFGSGVYKSNIQNSLVYGMIPVSTLGLPKDLAEDGFGNKLIYVVNGNYTWADYLANNIEWYFFSSFLESDISNIRILQVSTGNVIDGNAFAIISLGKNKYGAFGSAERTQSATTSSDIYEQQNYLRNVNSSSNSADFGIVAGNVNKVVITSENSGSDVFDDIVFFKTRSQMLMDFKGMFMIPCFGFVNYNTSYYGQTIYRNTNCATPSFVRPSKKCTAYGILVDQQACVN